MSELDLLTSVKQESFKPEWPCGDSYLINRTDSATTIILADGKGTGIKANLASTLCTTRLISLLEQGFSFRQAFYSVIDTMTKAGSRQLPYSVVQAVRMLKDGKATILNYGMPDPVLISRDKRVFTINGTIKKINGEDIKEINCFMEPRDSVVLVSDGVTHSGISRTAPEGWGSEGLISYINDRKQKYSVSDLPAKIIQQCIRSNSVSGGRDDISVLTATADHKKKLTILTSMPENTEEDRKFTGYFNEIRTPKVICGIGNAYLIAKLSGTETGAGIDLVTHTQSVLSHLFLLLDTPSAVTEEFAAGTIDEAVDLLKLVENNRQIDFIVGKQRNPLGKGVMPCHRIVPLLAEKLRKMDKVVTIKKV